MLWANLEKAQKRMKKYADLKRSERSFKVGDWVYIKLQPYRQTSVPGHIHSKLNPKYYGPYEIIEKKGPVAYKLNLPAGTTIHPVIHVSQLKLKQGDSWKINSRLPELGPDGELRVEPVQVIERRVIKRNNMPVVQWLVQWYNRPTEAATWEDYEVLAEHYPDFILEGKNALMGEVLSRENDEINGGDETVRLRTVGALDLTKSNELKELGLTGPLIGSKEKAEIDPAHKIGDGVKRPLAKGSRELKGDVAGDQ